MRCIEMSSPSADYQSAFRLIETWDVLKCIRNYIICSTPDRLIETWDVLKL